jgi:hypothetical protein
MTHRDEKTGGRPPKHHHRKLSDVKSLKRLDQRGSMAKKAKVWKQRIRDEAGYVFTVAQEAILDEAAWSWIMAGRLNDYLGNQETLVKAGKPDPVIELHRQASDGVSRHLERLRQAAPQEPIAEILQAIREKTPSELGVKPISRTLPPEPLETTSVAGQNELKIDSGRVPGLVPESPPLEPPAKVRALGEASWPRCYFDEIGHAFATAAASRLRGEVHCAGCGSLIRNCVPLVVDGLPYHGACASRNIDTDP